ncbi:hypothetical protein IWW36_004737 [Coemansia brasiliensis]|uniref:BZIP domain-containing protein n=1 Tax=Coemansia brasiliensis TaxID=2650707 RepID=A0A9W8LXR5_9FUNG|nr:hypothetical protein IWW36_004737 [Coemansia brasiliensis]
MNTDHSYPPYCQAPPMQWQSTDPSHHALPAHTGVPTTAPLPANDPYSYPGLPPINPPIQQMAQASVSKSTTPPGKAKRPRTNPGESGGSEKACSSDEAARILEERRKRNASASARFRKRRNERERELVMRCMFLENQLLHAVGPTKFEALMSKAPPVERSLLLSRHAQYSVNHEEEEGSPVSVSALTAPRSIDDVWSAYLKLSEAVACAVQRIDNLEAAE